MTKNRNDKNYKYAVIFFITLAAIVVGMCVLLEANEVKEIDVIELEFEGYTKKTGNEYAAFVDHEAKKNVYHELTDYERLYKDKIGLVEGQRYPFQKNEKWQQATIFRTVCDYISTEETPIESDCLMLEENIR